jgi:hypothetical protein
VTLRRSEAEIHSDLIRFDGIFTSAGVKPSNRFRAVPLKTHEAMTRHNILPHFGNSRNVENEDYGSVDDATTVWTSFPEMVESELRRQKASPQRPNALQSSFSIHSFICFRQPVSSNYLGVIFLKLCEMIPVHNRLLLPPDDLCCR